MNRIIKLLPLITTSILLLGLSNEYFYYKFFGIKIQYFLDASEILLLYSDSILFIVSSIIPVSILIYLLPEYEEDDILYLSLKNRFFRDIDYLIIFLLFLVVLSIAIGIINVFNHKNVFHDFKSIYYIFLIFTLVFIFNFIFSSIINHLSLKYNLTINYRFKSIILILLGYITLTFYFKFYYYKQVTKQKHYIGTEVYLKDGTVLLSDSSIYYIGKTKNYLFYYNEIKKSALIYPMSEVNKMSIKNKSYD